MAGTIITLWSARDFDFSALGLNSATTFDVCPLTPVLPFRDAMFVLRVHTINVTGTATFKFSAHPAAPSIDEPAGTFVDQSIASLTVSGSSSGDVLRGLIPQSAFGTHIQVRGTATQAKSSSETIQARVSAVLVGRR